MKNNILILFSIFLTLIFVPFIEAQDKVLKTGISTEWSIDEIRQKAIQNIEYVKDVSMFNPKDPNYKENQKALKAKVSFIKNRYIEYYSDKTYSVEILNNQFLSKYFIYDSNGNLVFICYQKFPKTIKNIDDYIKSIMDNTIYPKKVYKYNYPKGRLHSFSYDFNPTYQYIFKSNGEFIEYWLDDNAFDFEGKLILKRDIKPFTED